MPYYISDKQDDCSGWATVKVEKGMPKTLGCHTSKAGAISQMVALSLAEKIEPGGEYGKRKAGGKKAIIVDIDDTLIHASRRIDKTYNYVESLNVDVLLVTGRPESTRDATTKLLNDVDISYNRLYMNPGSSANSNSFKKAKAEELLKTYDIVLAIENNPDARRGYADLGIATKDPAKLPMVEDSSNRAVAVYKPTQGMKVAAARALRWKEEGKATGAGTPIGWGRATDIVQGRSMSLSVVKRMYSFFSRHEVDKKGKDFNNTSNPSNGRIMWDAWGGDSGFTWSSGIVDRESNKQRNLMSDVVSRANGRAEKIMATLRKINGLTPVSETRVSDAQFEIRAVGDKLTFSGYAAVFNSDSQPLPFIERIAPGAFKRSLQSRNDVKLLWNHDSGEPLASTRSGTMRLVEDSKGLRVEAELAPTTRGKDLSILMERGDIDKMSFGFNVQSDSWSPDGNVRTLESVRLLEVSIVTFPAYESSVAQVRSLDGIDTEQLSDALLALEVNDSLTPDQAGLLQNVIKQMTKGEIGSVEPVETVVQVEAAPEVNLLVLKQLKHELEGKML
jgi:HK97 family phage prohead protease